MEATPHFDLQNFVTPNTWEKLLNMSERKDWRQMETNPNCTQRLQDNPSPDEIRSGFGCQHSRLVNKRMLLMLGHLVSKTAHNPCNPDQALASLGCDGKSLAICDVGLRFLSPKPLLSAGFLAIWLRQRGNCFASDCDCAILVR